MPADIGGLTANFVINPIERSDPLEQIGGQRCRTGLMVLEYLAPEMRPASHFLNAIAAIELGISGVSICLKETGECLQFGLRMGAAADRMVAWLSMASGIGPPVVTPDQLSMCRTYSACFAAWLAKSASAINVE